LQKIKVVTPGGGWGEKGVKITKKCQKKTNYYLEKTLFSVKNGEGRGYWISKSLKSAKKIKDKNI